MKFTYKKMQVQILLSQYTWKTSDAKQINENHSICV